MADVSYNLQAQISKGSFNHTFAAGGVTANMATAGMLTVTLNLGTSVTTISTAAIGQVGLTIARSLATASTHTVSFGRYSGSTLYETVALRGGEAAMLRLAAGDYAAKAAVEGTRMLLHIFEG
jgi:hypothetical protein